MTPFSAPFGGLCPDCDLSAGGGVWPHPPPVPVPAKGNRRSRGRRGQNSEPLPLCATQARPAQYDGLLKTAGRHPRPWPFPPHLPEGDHFPGPGPRGSASAPHEPNRPRIARTPSGVTAAERRHCRRADWGGDGKTPSPCSGSERGREMSPPAGYWPPSRSRRLHGYSPCWLAISSTFQPPCSRFSV